MLEYLAHLDPEDAPDDLILAAVELPDSISRKRLGPVICRELAANSGSAELTQLGMTRGKGGELCVAGTFRTGGSRIQLFDQSAALRL